MRYEEIRGDIGRLCRACLNEKYQLRLTSKHCEYMIYSAICPQCGQRKNIVDGLDTFARMQVYLKRKKKNAQ